MIYSYINLADGCRRFSHEFKRATISIPFVICSMAVFVAGYMLYVNQRSSRQFTCRLLKWLRYGRGRLPCGLPVAPADNVAGRAVAKTNFCACAGVEALLDAFGQLKFLFGG
jgi:hypothetical protein